YRGGNQDQAGDVVLPRVSGAFKAVDADGVHTQFFRLQGVLDGDTLVDNDDARFLQLGPVLDAAVARGLHHLDATVDDDIDIVFVRWWLDGGKDGHIDAEGLAGHGLAAGNLVAQIFRGGLGEAGEDAQAAGVGDGGGQLGLAHPLHAALDN